MLVISSRKLLNMQISKVKCYPFGIISLLVMAHYTLGVWTCPTHIPHVLVLVTEKHGVTLLQLLLLAVDLTVAIPFSQYCS